MRGYVGTDHRHQNFKLFLGWFSGFREELVKKCCLPKCVLTPKDHFERYFFWSTKKCGLNPHFYFFFKLKQDCLLQGQAPLDQRVVFHCCTQRLRSKKGVEKTLFWYFFWGGGMVI